MFVDLKDCNKSILAERQKLDKYDKGNDIKRAKLDFFMRLNKINYGRILMKSYSLFLSYKLAIRTFILLDQNDQINKQIVISFDFFENCAPEGLFMCIELFVTQIKSFLTCNENFQSWDKLFNIGRGLIEYLKILKVEGNEYMTGIIQIETLLMVMINNLQHNSQIKNDSFVNNLSEFINYLFFLEISDNNDKLFGHYLALANHFHSISKKANQSKQIFFLQSFFKNFDKIFDKNLATFCYNIVQMFFMKIKYNELSKYELILLFQTLLRSIEQILNRINKMEIIFQYYEFFTNIMTSQIPQLILNAQPNNDGFFDLWMRYVKISSELVNNSIESGISVNMSLFSNIKRLFCNILNLLFTTKYLHRKKLGLQDQVSFGNKEKMDSYNRWKNTIHLVNKTSPRLFRCITDLK